MKTAGIILIIFGCMSTIGGLRRATNEGKPNFAGIPVVIVGAFLVTQANKKAKNEAEKDKWDTNDDQMK